MKTFRLIGMVLFAIMMCVNFPACSSDDDEENFESSRVVFTTDYYSIFYR